MGASSSPPRLRRAPSCSWPRRTLAVTAAFLLLGLLSCDSLIVDVERIEVTLPENLTVGQGVQAEARVVASGQGDGRVPEIHWRSERPEVATVSASGWVEAVSPGTTRIAAMAQGVDGIVTVRVDAAPEPPSITTVLLPDGMVGEEYRAPLVATGGEEPYEWRVRSGLLPDGLQLSGGDGVIGGVPTREGQWSFAVQVAGSDGLASQERVLSIMIEAAPEPPTILTASLPNGTVGEGYSATLEAAGGETPYEWALVAGSLPEGLVLSSAGEISGAPEAAESQTFTVQVTGANDLSSERELSIEVEAAPEPPTILTASLPNGIVGESYSAALEAEGGETPYTWSVASGSLPGGLSLSPAGVISGTPTAAGTATFTVRVTGGNGESSTRALSIVIVEPEPEPEPPTITTSSLPGGTVGESYSATLEATGGETPYTWSVASGSLPGGLSLSPAGVISGTPTAAGTGTFTVRVTGGNGESSTRALSIVIEEPEPQPEPPTITTSSLPGGTVGESYSATLEATGGETPYTWSVVSGELPAGLSLSSAGEISGTPSEGGAAEFLVRVTGSNALSDSAHLTIPVSEPDMVSVRLRKVYDGSGTVVSEPAGLYLPAGYVGEETEAQFPRGTTITLHVLDSIGFTGHFCGRQAGPTLDAPCQVQVLDHDTLIVGAQFIDMLPMAYLHGGGSVRETPSDRVIVPGSFSVFFSPLGVFDWFEGWRPVNSGVQVEAVPDEGWRFREWTRGCDHRDTLCQFVIRMEDCCSPAVRAVFEPLPSDGSHADELWPTFDGPHEFLFTFDGAEGGEASDSIALNSHTHLSVLPVAPASSSWASAGVESNANGEDVLWVRVNASALGVGEHQTTLVLNSWKAQEITTEVSVRVVISP